MNKLIFISLNTVLHGLTLGVVFSSLYCVGLFLVTLLSSSHSSVDLLFFSLFVFVWICVGVVGSILGAASGLVIGVLIGIIKPVSPVLAMFLSFGLCICSLPLYMWGVFGKITPNMADLQFWIVSPVLIYVASCAWLGKYAHAWLKRTQLEQSKQSEQSLVVPTA
ncbi:MAG: hypothetical protein KIH69_014285 [Anaerolineae bacterium]|nr:hypothetical protein [Anaerolineae bacterium]